MLEHYYEEKMDTYLHDCHADIYSENNATVLQKPFLHTGHAALKRQVERKAQEKKNKSLASGKMIFQNDY